MMNRNFPIIGSCCVVLWMKDELRSLPDTFACCFRKAKTLKANHNAHLDFEQFKLGALGAIATPGDVSAITKSYAYGNTTPDSTLAVAIRFTDGTNFVDFLMNECTVEDLGGFTIDAEGNATSSATITATAANTYKQWGQL